MTEFSCRIRPTTGLRRDSAIAENYQEKKQQGKKKLDENVAALTAKHIKVASWLPLAVLVGARKKNAKRQTAMKGYKVIKNIT